VPHAPPRKPGRGTGRIRSRNRSTDPANIRRRIGRILIFVPDSPEDDDDDETADEAKATVEKVDVKPHESP